MSVGTSAMELSVVGRTDVGQRRKNNEDSLLVADLARVAVPVDLAAGLLRFAVTERGILLAVSDGMGGAEAGEVASALALESLRLEIESAQSGSEGGEASRLDRGTGSAPVTKQDPEVALRAAVERANHEVWKASKQNEREGMGATLTACLVLPGQAYLAEVGDSRAYLLRDGKLVQVTRDQSYVQLLVDSGGLTPEAARNSPLKNVILQAIGKSDSVVVALRRLALRRGDRLLLCSDGLSGEVADDALEQLMGEPSLEAACSHLIESANRQGGKDNITVVVASVDGEGVAEFQAGDTVDDTLETLRPYDPTSDE